MNQSTTYRTTWLVWLLAGIGLGTGALTLAIVGCALWAVMEAKSRQDSLHERLGSIVEQSQRAGQQADADLRELLSDRPRYALAEYRHPPALDQATIDGLRHEDAGLAAALDRATAAAAKINSLYAQCRQWADQDEAGRAAQGKLHAELTANADAQTAAMRAAALALREAELELMRRQAASTGALLQRAWRAVLLTAALALGFFLGIAWKLPRAVADQIEAIRQSVQEIELARRKLKAQNIALEQTQKRAEAASRGKSEFLAMVSHELRTPLSAVLGYSDILLTGPLTTGAREAVLAVQRNGQHLLSVVNDIMDLSKIEVGRLDVQIAPCSAVGVVRETADLLEPRCRAKHLALATRFVGRFPAVIQADAVRLRQILINLLATAVELTEEGEISLTTQCLSVAAPHWTVEILAPGVGLTAAQIEQLFEPFAHPAAARAGGKGDMGLGLSISRRLATLLGGEVRVSSELCGGTTLSLTVPLRLLDGTPCIDPTRLPSFPELAGDAVLSPGLPPALTALPMA